MFKFNIGSAVNGVDKVLPAWCVLAALWEHGFEGLALAKTEQSETETTYVVTAERFDDKDHYPTHEAAVYAVCEALQQDAIAYKVGDTGYLVGPKAEDWGGLFIPEYFIE